MELLIHALHGIFYLLPHDLDFDHAMCLNSISCMNMNFVGEVGSFSSILVCYAFIERKNQCLINLNICLAFHAYHYRFLVSPT